MNTGAEVRAACRSGSLTGPTPGLAMGYVQANLVILPRDWAWDFLLFCQRNPKPCPLLDVTEPGDPEPRFIAPAADLRTDLPAYRVWENGTLVEEPTDIRRFWRSDLVSFLVGCSFTFENALLASGMPVRHIEEGRNVPMYRTNIACRPAGRFHGPMVVSMRPLTPGQAVTATRICRTSAGPRSTGSHLRPRRNRHPRCEPTGFRGGGFNPPRRNACVLGVRRDAAGGRDGSEAPVRDHAQARAHVRQRFEGRGPGRRMNAGHSFTIFATSATIRSTSLAPSLPFSNAKLDTTLRSRYRITVTSAVFSMR